MMAHMVHWEGVASAALEDTTFQIASVIVKPRAVAPLFSSPAASSLRTCSTPGTQILEVSRKFRLPNI